MYVYLTQGIGITEVFSHAAYGVIYFLREYMWVDTHTDKWIDGARHTGSTFYTEF